MVHAVAERVKETTTTTGTGPVTLAGAVSGFQTFAAGGIANGDTVPYAIVAGADWETGIGTYSTTGPTLTRTTVLDSSTGGAAINFPAGTKDVFIADLADRSVIRTPANNIVLPKATGIVAPPSGSGSLAFVDDQGTTRLEYMNAAGDVVRLARDNVLTVRNNSGVTLNKGDLVYISDANSNIVRVTKARADAASTSPAVGMVLDTSITDGSDGRVMKAGYVFGLNTSAYTDGEIIYLSAATAGAFTDTPPPAGFKQRVGWVVSAHASQGIVLVDPVGVGVRLDSAGHAQLPVVLNAAEPAAPPSNLLTVYGRYLAGRAMLKQRGPSNLDTVLQPFLGGNSIWLVSPNTTTTVSAVGGAVSAVGTISHPNPAAGGLGDAWNQITAATALTAGGTGHTRLITQRGSAAGATGFFYSTRFWFPAAGDILEAGFFGGLTAGTLANIATNISAGTNHSVGVTFYTPAGDSRATKFAVHTKGTGTQVLVDTGIVFAINTLYEVIIFCEPYDVTTKGVTVEVRDLTNGTVFVHAFPNSEAQLPATASLLRPLTTIVTNNTTAKNIRIKKIYLEMDF